jgi:succinate-semialdehyde dehydrogenase/glutarate-semialdehyde dehydrogenase
VINPETEEVIAEAPEVDAQSVEQALAAAKDAFQTWSRMPLSQRQPIILKYADLLEQNRDEIIDLLVAETGKPIDNAEYDFGMLTTCLRFFLRGSGSRASGGHSRPGRQVPQLHAAAAFGRGRGLPGLELPALESGLQAGPRAGAGCTAIIKPSRLTPLATLACADLLIEAGLPAGVVNVISGTDYGVTDRCWRAPFPPCSP